MATADQIAEVRAAVNEPADVDPYTDALIGSLIDSYGVAEAEHKIWVSKRNTVADLVAMSEGGSSRQMNQIFDHYSAIVATYEAGDATTKRPTRTRAIVRA